MSCCLPFWLLTLSKYSLSPLVMSSIERITCWPDEVDEAHWANQLDKLRPANVNTEGSIVTAVDWKKILMFNCHLKSMRKVRANVLAKQRTQTRGTDWLVLMLVHVSEHKTHTKVIPRVEEEGGGGGEQEEKNIPFLLSLHGTHHHSLLFPPLYFLTCAFVCLYIHNPFWRIRERKKKITFPPCGHFKNNQMQISLRVSKRLGESWV